MSQTQQWMYIPLHEGYKYLSFTNKMPIKDHVVQQIATSSSLNMVAQLVCTVCPRKNNQHKLEVKFTTKPEKVQHQNESRQKKKKSIF